MSSNVIAAVLETRFLELLVDVVVEAPPPLSDFVPLERGVAFAASVADGVSDSAVMLADLRFLGDGFPAVVPFFSSVAVPGTSPSLSSSATSSSALLALLRRRNRLPEVGRGVAPEAAAAGVSCSVSGECCALSLLAFLLPPVLTLSAGDTLTVTAAVGWDRCSWATLSSAGFDLDDLDDLAGGGEVCRSAALVEAEASAVAVSSVLRLDRETRFAGVASAISSICSVATSASAGFDLDDLDDLVDLDAEGGGWVVS